MNDQNLLYGFVLLNSVLLGFLVLSLVNLFFLLGGTVTPDTHSVETLRSTFQFQESDRRYQSTFQSVDQLNMVSRWEESTSETSSESGNNLDDLNAEAIREIESTSLPVELIGTMEGPEGYRLATLRNLENRKIRSLIPGESWNNMTVKNITEGAVILRNKRNDQTEILRLKRKYLAERADGDPSDQARKVSRYEINQAIQSNLNNILTSVNPQPVIRNGRIVGIKVSKMKGKPGDLLTKLGFKKNDVIRRINGEKVDSIEKAMNLWTQLRNKRSVQFTLGRNGKKKVLEYSLTR